MRIAVWYNLPSGGAKRALYDHVRGLVERGHTVESWCPSTTDRNYLSLHDLITEHLVPFNWEAGTAKNRLSDMVTSYRNTVGLIEAMDQHCRRCADEINRGGFDLLFANNCMWHAASAIGRYVNIPKVLYLQDPYRLLYEVMPHTQNLPWIALPEVSGFKLLKSVKKFPRDFLELKGLRIQAREELLNAKAYDAILVNSFFSRESILRCYGLNARVCYLGIDTGRFVNRHLERESFVVGLGVLHPQKNIGLTIEALSRVREPRPRLVWVGSRGYKSYIEELTAHAQSVGVEFKILVGVDDDELISILNRAQMMVHMPRLEPFGYAPLEANACGAPVVATAEGGMRETVEDGVNGLLTEPEPRAVAATIGRLSNDRAYARRLGENGSKLVAEKWSLDAAIERLEQRLDEVLGEKAGQKDLYCVVRKGK